MNHMLSLKSSTIWQIFMSNRYYSTRQRAENNKNIFVYYHLCFIYNFTEDRVYDYSQSL